MHSCLACLLLAPFDHQALDVVVEVFERGGLALLAHSKRLSTKEEQHAVAAAQV